MSSFYSGGYIRMNPEIESENYYPQYGDGYPLAIPKVHIEAAGEEYYPQVSFSWSDDSVVITRDKLVVKYTSSYFAELLAKNEAGEIVWVDGRNAPCSGCWEGEYLGEDRAAHEYTVEEYNLETKKKKKYKVSLAEETDLNIWDYNSISNYVDADKLGSHFKIENGVLIKYAGNDTKLIIPNGVTEVGYDPFWGKKDFETIEIPNTLIKISDSLFASCKTKEIIVADDNPKFYSKDGCLIDKETGTLIWGYAGNTIPCDDSIHKIGPKAFCYRDDLENISIPDNITEIGSYAFGGCKNLKQVIMSDAVIQIDDRAFFGCEFLSLVRLSQSLTMLKPYTFFNCKNLETIDVPDSIVTIDIGAFGLCDNLKEIGVSHSLVEIIEKALAAKLVRNGDRWLINRPVSIHKTSLAIDSTGCVF